MLNSMATKIILLKTKMVPPPVLSHNVARKRLLVALEQAVDYKLILLSAPAGFGKTTALAQWVNLLRGKHAFAWLSLDSGDNKSDVFFQYFIASLQQIDQSLGQDALNYLTSTNRFDIAKTLNSLVNDLVDYGEHLFLFLDDYHFIESPEIEQFIEVLLNLAPANFHLILSSRALPDLPIASKHANNDVLQLSIADLRFDLSEAKQFFLAHSNGDLSEEQLEKLYNRSEGWAAGLQLVSLYLRKASANTAKLVELTGSLRDIADYLAIEVLDQQPEEMQTFLLSTSILKRFNTEVCNALLGRQDAHKMLQDIENLNLFIIALDEERNWYRYHHIFQQFLQARLHQLFADRVTSLYCKASHWFCDHQLFHEAVDYALAGEDYNLAAGLIEKYTIDEFVEGRMPQVNEWVNRIPEAVKSTHPRLLLLQGTALYHMNAHDEARKISKQLGESIACLKKAGSLPLKDQQELEHESRILKAGISMSSDCNHDVIELMSDPPQSSQQFIVGAANNILAYSYYQLGEFFLARQHLHKARQAHQEINARFGVVYSDCFESMLEIAQGNLVRALEIFNHYEQRKLERPNKQIYVASVVDIMLGIIEYEMNQLDTAHKRLQLSLPRLEEVGHIRLILMGYAVLAKIAVARKDCSTAYKLLDYMLLLSGRQPQESHRLFIEALRIRILLSDDKAAAAVNSATMLGAPMDESISALPDTWSELEFLRRLIQIRLLLYAGQYEAALTIITPLLVYLNECQQRYHYLQVLLLQARCYWQLTDQQRAFDSALALIELAAPQSMLRLLLDEGEIIHRLFLSLSKDKVGNESIVVQDFVRQCCVYFEKVDAGQALNESSESNKTELVEPLSEREMSILTLMAEGKSNADIAKQLFISENTVKWHGGNIFGKLNVKNRTAAVITAKELKLME